MSDRPIIFSAPMTLDEQPVKFLYRFKNKSSYQNVCVLKYDDGVEVIIYVADDGAVRTLDARVVNKLNHADFHIVIWLDQDGKPVQQADVETTVRDLPLNLAKASLEEAVIALISEYEHMIKAHFNPSWRCSTREEILRFIQQRAKPCP